MKIVHVCMLNRGGIAEAAKRLHVGLLRLGQESLLFFGDGVADEVNSITFNQTPAIHEKVLRRWRRWKIRSDFARYEGARKPGQEIFADDRSMFGSMARKQLPPADVIHLHQIDGLMDYGDFFQNVSNSVPVVWTLHAMNPFTGGCYYDAGCGKFVQSCGACPELYSDRENDLSRQIWRRKRRALQEVRQNALRLVADSDWLAGEAARSSLLGGYPIRTIYYGLDTDSFLPHERKAARAALGVDPEAPTIGFAAVQIEHRRKGLRYLLDALSTIPSHQMPTLLSFGDGAAIPELKGKHIHLGRLTNPRVMSDFYSAADVFVMPSIQEAFGQTALEAMACGTPVVAFATGGLREFVLPGRTGLLVPTGDVAGLKEAIFRVLGDRELRDRMSETCRQRVLANYTLERQAREYVEVYEELLAARQPKVG